MKISDSELRLMELIWQEGGIRSGELVKKAYEALGWKKSTVYTVIKKLTLKNAVRSENAVVIPLCTRDEVLGQRSGEVLSSGYSGSLPMFLAAFLKKEKLTREEAAELKKLIDDFTESEEG